jgi:L,D-transpeptidase YcbB
MRGLQFDRFLAGAALALLVSATPGAAFAAPMDDAAIEAAIPVPEAANVPPPTIADFGPVKASEPATSTTAASKPQASKPKASIPELGETMPLSKMTAVAPAMSDAEINAAVPVPEPAKVEPITVKDLLASPATDIDPADRPIADKLRELVTGKLGRFAERKDDRKAVEAFYAARAFSPVWIEKGVATARAKAAIARIQAADQDGLDPSDYPTPDFAAATDPAALAEDELKLTDAVLTYARQAQVGPIHFTRVSGDITYKQDIPDPADILAKVTKAKDVAAALDSYNPPQAGYKALKAKLAELSSNGGKKDDEPKVVRIPSGPMLRPGEKSPRVVQLRKRLNVPGDETSQLFDPALVEALRNFQKEKGLSPDGVLGPNTLAALNGKTHHGDPVNTIIVNMLRWRWLPRHLGEPKLGDAYVMLNIPDFTLKVVRHGKTVWHTKVVTGKPSTPTPMLSETMKFITVNPTWNVPPSIVYKEYLPALQQDPTVLARMGLKVTQNRDGSVHIYQPPGDGNALGRIRFNFPNKFLVYQHDTPDKYLFKKTVRAYSHGCMRVEDPAKYAEVLLSIELPKEGYTVERLHHMYGPSEININFPIPLPVHITYQTAYVDDAGKLQLRNDIYGRDARMLALLKGSERRVADIPIDRPAPSYARPPVDLPRGVITSNNGYSGPSFFDLLFGGFNRAPSPPRRVREGRAYYPR